MDHGMDAQSLSNVFAPAPVVAGGILKHNGTQYVNYALGTGNQVLAVNAGGTDVVYTSTLTGLTISGGTLSGTIAGTPSLSGTIAFTNTSPFSIVNGQTLTVSVTAQTVGAATLTVPNFAGVSDTFSFITLAQTLSNKTLASPTISGTITMSGTPTVSGNFALNAQTISGTATFSGANTFSATQAFTNSSPFSVANGQTLTVSVTAQTVGAATLTVPNFASVSDTFAFITLAQTLSNKTLASPTISGTIAGTYNIGGTPTLTVTLNANAQTISGGFTSTGTITMSGSNISLAGNKIITTSYNIFESATAFGVNSILFQQSAGNNVSEISIAPSGTNNSSGLLLHRLNTISTNIEALVLGTDQQGSSELTIQSYKAGTGTQRPINIYMATTKLLSFDTANTVTSYVQHNFQSIIAPQTSTGTTGQYAFNSNGGATLTIVNNSTATPYGSDTPQMLMFIVNTSNGNSAWFIQLGGVTMTKIGGATEFTVTQGTASSTNVYLAANIVTVENKTGGSVNYRITAFRFG